MYKENYCQRNSYSNMGKKEKINSLNLFALKETQRGFPKNSEKTWGGFDAKEKMEKKRGRNASLKASIHWKGLGQTTIVRIMMNYEMDAIKVNTKIFFFIL